MKETKCVARKICFGCTIPLKLWLNSLGLEGFQDAETWQRLALNIVCTGLVPEQESKVQEAGEAAAEGSLLPCLCHPWCLQSW